MSVSHPIRLSFLRYCPQFLSHQVSQAKHTPLWLMAGQANNNWVLCCADLLLFIWNCYTNNTAN